jgi:hypothetical protein
MAEANVASQPMATRSAVANRRLKIVHNLFAQTELFATSKPCTADGM